MNRYSRLVEFLSGLYEEVEKSKISFSSLEELANNAVLSSVKSGDIDEEDFDDELEKMIAWLSEELD